MHSVSVAAAVIDAHGRALAIRRTDNNRWEPPGGVLELDESIEDGLVREVEEETGYVIRPLKLTGVYKNMTRGIVALVFSGAIIGGDQRPGGEARELRWLSPDELDAHM